MLGAYLSSGMESVLNSERSDSDEAGGRRIGVPALDFARTVFISSAIITSFVRWDQWDNSEKREGCTWLTNMRCTFIDIIIFNIFLMIFCPTAKVKA